MKELFFSLVQKHDPALCSELWETLETAYNAPERYYHNFLHLEKLYAALTEARSEIRDRDTLLFTLFYHDAVYDVERQDNEAQSAVLAVNSLHRIGYPEDRAARCGEMILATKSHAPSTDADTNLFNDADLAILGTDPETYAAYTANIRKEYAAYPDAAYASGRLQALQHFLEMDSIFKTPHFAAKYETQARKNLENELKSLQGKV